MKDGPNRDEEELARRAEERWDSVQVRVHPTQRGKAYMTCSILGVISQANIIGISDLETLVQQGQEVLAELRGSAPVSPPHERVTRPAVRVRTRTRS